MNLNEVLITGKKAAVYARVSNDDQDHEMQLQYIKEYLAKYGCEIAGEYIDHGRSASKLKLEQRKAIFQMLADAKSGMFDFIAVYKRDRIARQNEDHFLIRSILSKADMPIVLCNENCLYQSNDKILDMIQNAMTSYETQQNSDRTTDHYADNTKKGNYMGGILPFGYKHENGVVQIVEEDAELVRKMFNLYKTGIGFHTIAKKHLLPGSRRAHERKKYAKKTRDWTAEDVETIITSYQYTGRLVTNHRQKDRRTLTPREQWVISPDNSIPVIIPDKEWEYCYRLLQDKSREKRAPSHFSTTFFLRDLIKCDNEVDGKKIHGERPLPMKTRDQRTKDKKTGKKQGNRVYQCKVCNYSIPISEIHPKVDSVILKKIATEFTHGDLTELHDQIKLNNFSEIEALHAEIQQLDKQISEYLVTLDKSKDELKKRIPRKEQERKAFLLLLQRHQLHAKQRIEDLKQLIERKKERILHIEYTLNDFDHFYDMARKRTWMNELDGSDQEYDHLMRRLSLYLLDEVLIKQNNLTGNIETHIKANGDLTPIYELKSIAEE